VRGVGGVVAGLVAAGVLGACTSGAPTSSAGSLVGVWGSDAAGFVATDTGATLWILAPGSCYGSYAGVARPLPTPSFDLTGTYTQLTGVYPGKIQYAAELKGTVTGGVLFLAVDVPGLKQSFGPFTLTRGVSSSWPACLYP
jgi:hypothetical protein